MININDDYAEFTVKGRERSGGIAFTILIIVTILLGFMVALIIDSFLKTTGVGTVGTCVIIGYILFGVPALWRMTSKKSVEYDYTYIDNDLEICEVYNKTKRKLVITVHLEHARCIAPEDSEWLKGYEGEGIDKVIDFSANEETDEDSEDEVAPIPTYALIVDKNGVNVKILIAGDEHMLTLMKYRNKDRFYD